MVVTQVRTTQYVGDTVGVVEHLSYWSVVTYLADCESASYSIDSQGLTCRSDVLEQIVD